MESYANWPWYAMSKRKLEIIIAVAWLTCRALREWVQSFIESILSVRTFRKGFAMRPGCTFWVLRRCLGCFFMMAMSFGAQWALAAPPIDVVRQPYLLESGLTSRSISFENPT